VPARTRIDPPTRDKARRCSRRRIPRRPEAQEPENRLVARSPEHAWEEKLRAVEAIEQEHARCCLEEPPVIGVGEHAGLRALGENLPRIWHASTTSAADRKRILRFIVREVVLDQKRLQGQVWLKIVWQTGATSEHLLQRRVHTYRDYLLTLIGCSGASWISMQPAKWTRRSRQY
jgi:hypothetical protein